MRFLLGPLIIALGLLMIKNSFWLTEQTGKIDFAEKYLKPPLGGTYTWWKLVGLFFIVMALLWMFGYLSGNASPEV